MEHSDYEWWKRAKRASQLRAESTEDIQHDLPMLYGDFMEKSMFRCLAKVLSGTPGERQCKNRALLRAVYYSGYAVGIARSGYVGDPPDVCKLHGNMVLRGQRVAMYPF